MEYYEYLIGAYITAWAVGFSMGWKFRIFKQAVEHVS